MDKKIALEQYYTHKVLADYMCFLFKKEYKGDISSLKVLEPSAGNGRLIEACLRAGFKEENIFAYDIDENNCNILRNKFPKAKVKCCDFLNEEIEELFDFIIMNPPWGKCNSKDDREFFRQYGKIPNSTVKRLEHIEKLLENEDIKKEYRKYQYEKNKIKSTKFLTYEEGFLLKCISLLKDGNSLLIALTPDFLNNNVTNKEYAKTRETFYKKLRYLFKFHNELKLFEDVGNTIKYVMSIFGKHSKENFILMDNLFHPQTIEHSFYEHQEAPYPGMKNKEGKWELRGHPFRKIEVNQELLERISVFTGSKNPWQTISPSLHGKYELELFLKLSKLPKLKSIEYFYSQGMNETNSPKAGLISRTPTSHPLEETVLTGPNLFVANPCYQEPNEGCKSKGDFSLVDLEHLPEDFVPKSVYVLTKKGQQSEEYLRKTPCGTVHNFSYRMAARFMLAPTGMRTLSNALLRPFMTHINGIISLSFSNSLELLLCTGTFHSLLLDFLLRNLGGNNFYDSTCQLLPTMPLSCKENKLVEMLLLRTLRLNALSSHYASLYEDIFPSLSLESKKMDLGKLYLECMDSSFSSFETLKKKERLSYSKLPSSWNKEVPLRVIEDREQALCEIDALTSLLFGISKDTLLNLYRSQFAVLQKNLQDFEDQKPQEGKDYFPRYMVMKKAYEMFEEYQKKHHILTIEEELQKK